MRILLFIILLPFLAFTAGAQVALVPGAQTTVTCSLPPPPPPVAWVYTNGSFAWQDWDANATADYADKTGVPLSGSADIKITITGKWGIWQPHPIWTAAGTTFDTKPFANLVLWLKPTVANQKWSIYAESANDTPIVPAVSVNSYGAPPMVGVWTKYVVPLKVLMTTSAGVLTYPMYKFAVQDQTALPTNTWYVDNVEFTP